MVTGSESPAESRKVWNRANLAIALETGAH